MRIFRSTSGVSMRDNKSLPAGAYSLSGDPVNGTLTLGRVNTDRNEFTNVHFSMIFRQDGTGFTTYQDCYDYVQEQINFSGGGGSVFSIREDRFFDTEAERDAAIPSPTEGEYCALLVTGETFYRIQRYETNAWVDRIEIARGPKGDKGDQGDPGITQAQADTLTSLETVQEGRLPVKISTGYGSSSLEETDDLMIFLKTVMFPPGSFMLGDSIVSSAARGIVATSLTTGRKGIFNIQLFDDSSFSKATVFDDTQTVTTGDIQITADSVASGNVELNFSTQVQNDVLFLLVRFKPDGGALTGTLNFQIRLSETGNTVYDEDITSADLTDMGGGVFQFAIENNGIFDANTRIYIRTSGASLLGGAFDGTDGIRFGDTSNGNFFPYIQSVVLPVVRQNIATENFVNDGLSGKEDGLGNPTSDGQILSSTAAGVRSWVNPSPGSGADNDAIHDNIAGEIEAISEKTDPVGADIILIEDSEDSNNKKKVQIGNLDTDDSDAIHNNVAGEIDAITEKTTIHNDDIVLIEDSEDSNNKKKVSVSTLTGGQAYHAPTLQNFNIDIPSRVNLGTDLNVQKQITFDAHNSANLTSLQLLVVTGDNKVISLPISDGANSVNVTLSGIVTSSNATLTFQLSGTDLRSNTITSNTVTINIADVAAHEYIYDGLNSSNDFSTVDISGFDQQEVGSATGQTLSISTGAVTSGQYFGILTRNIHTLTIFDTVLQQDVTSIFTRTQDVRTIGGQSFDSYVIGPLNADSTGQTYNVTIN